MKARILGVILLASMPACSEGAGSAGRDARGSAKNLLLITIDTLRADRVGWMGYERDTTPLLDARAVEGQVFEAAIAQAPWTRPSIATLMTGLHPSTVGLTCHNFRVPKGECDVLPQSMTTLAETLRGVGHRTAGFVANINVDPIFGFDQGFREYVSISELLSAEDPDWRMKNTWKSGGTELLTDRAIQWLDGGGGDEPFFLYLHYLDPHEPYDPPAEDAALFPVASYGEGKTPAMEAAYDAEIHFVDRELERLFARLDRDGLWETTAVLIVSDHGEEFEEHGGWYHGYTVFDEQLRVPMLAWWPGIEPGRFGEQVRILDVMPTVLDLLGVAPASPLQGRSLLPLVRGEAWSEDGALSELGYRPLASFRSPPWKLIVNEATGDVQLFDVERDPAETADLAAENPGVVAELLERRRELALANEGLGSNFERDAAGVSISPEQIERLEALGYVDGE